MKKLLIITLLLCTATLCAAQGQLSLDTCRARALRANLGLKRAEAKREQTDALKHAALWQMLPKVSANGGYVWMDRSVNLLSDEQKERVGHMGDNVQADIAQALHDELDGLPLFGSALADALGNALGNGRAISALNGVGEDIVNALETDTRNIGVAAVTLTQPIYMGGKLLAAYRAASLLDELSGVQLDKEREATLLAVDEAYWQVVSVQQKKELAEQFASLLDTLEHNVQLLVEAEMATKGDLAKVRVKHSEAQMTLTKATNGLALAKMLLAQRCGMPLGSDFEVSPDGLEAGAAEGEATRFATADMDAVYSRRAELRMLRLADSLALQGVRVAASTLKPNVVATGGYMLSNPNVFDGFSNSWGGTWMAGVAVNVPIAHPGGIYSLTAAKATRREAQLQLREAEEMIELQVNKLGAELELAYRHRAEAESNLEAAEESMRLADESFREGMCSSSDLLAAQTAWMQAESELTDAKIEIAMGRLYLRQALGRNINND